MVGCQIAAFVLAECGKAPRNRNQSILATRAGIWLNGGQTRPKRPVEVTHLSVRPLWRFVLLNFVVLAGLVGSLFFVPGDTSLLKYAVVSTILIAFLNYSLAVWPAITGKKGSEDARKGAAKAYRSTAMIAVSWLFLIVFERQFGLIMIGVSVVVIIVVGGAIWIGKKSAASGQ
jgi:hypothetical protein